MMELIDEMTLKEKRNALRNAPFPYKRPDTETLDGGELDSYLQAYLSACGRGADTDTANQEWNGGDGTAYRTIDLFAGIGGIRSAYAAFGCRNVFSSEIDRHAVRTYLLNYGEECVGDITKVDAADIPQFDILLGGFPCQAFSHAGLRRGFDDIGGRCSSKSQGY